MGGKSSSKPKATTPEPRQPDSVMAQEAAARALEARGNVTAAQAAEDEQDKQARVQTLGGMAKPKRKRDPGSIMGAQNMQQSAVLTG